MKPGTALAVLGRALSYPVFDKIPVSYTASRPGSGLLGLATVPDASGLKAMGAVSTLYSVVDLLSSSTAQVGWHLYRTGTPGKVNEDDRDEVTKHAALALWNKPNPFMDRHLFVQRTQQHIDLVGESFWVVERAGTLPIALWPVRPDRMREVPDPANFLNGWVYQSPGGEQVPLAVDDVIHLMSPDPDNIYRGLSPVRALLTDLESVTLAAQFTKAFFRNGAMPGGVLEAPGTMEDREFRDVTDRWRESHQGVNNAHRVAVLENGLQWKSVQLNMRDMEFVALRDLSREMIREAYRVHQHMLGLSDESNRANAVAASLDFARWCSVPRLDRIKQALNEVLLPMFGGTGKGVEFCYDPPTDEDAEIQNATRDSKVTAAVALIGAGFNPDQTMKAIGLPAIDWEKPEPPPAPVLPPGAGGAPPDGTEPADPLKVPSKRTDEKEAVPAKAPAKPVPKELEKA